MATDVQVDLGVLQERCRKDPLSYEDHYHLQRRHFGALLESAKLRPSDENPRLIEMAGFVASVSHCYATERESIAPSIIEFLTESGVAMNPEVRRSLVRVLGLLRARDSADANLVIPLFFRLLVCNDKALRRMLHGHIVADIKKMHMSGGGTGGLARRQVQTFLFGMMNDPSEVLVKRGLRVLVDLFRKRIWRDAKCANMIASVCFHRSVSVAIIGAKFILDSESKDDYDAGEYDSDDSDSERKENAQKTVDGQRASDLWKTYKMTGKKSTKKRKRMEKVIARKTRVKTKAYNSNAERDAFTDAQEAMMLLNDPQEFAERLFKDLQTKRKKESYERRLIFINLLTRLVGTHQLMLFNLYGFLQRYLQPAQPEVTRVLAYLTQACHDLVPCEVLHPILRGLADVFVSERSSPVAVAAGINTIRAICARVPLAILDEEAGESIEGDNPEAALLDDLVQYNRSKDWGICMAARGLIALYREAQPALLQKKERGKDGAEMVRRGETGVAKAYGEHVFATGVEGIELLNQASEDESGDEDGDGEEVEAQVEEEGDENGKEEGEDVENVGENSDEEVKEEDAGEENGDEDGSGGDAKDETETENAGKVDALRILDDNDFALIRKRRAEKTLGQKHLVKHTGDAVDPDDLQGPLRQERLTAAQRLEVIKAGREGRQFGGGNSRKNKTGGSSNQEKLKTKSNAMVIHKRRKKSSAMSRRDRQIGKRRKRDYRGH